MKAVLALALVFVVAVSAETNHKDAIPMEEYMISSRKYPLLTLFYLSRGPMVPRDGRIVGGQQSTAGQFPYQVALYITTSDGLFFCGGSLIKNDFVLTAAHCVDGLLKQVEVVLGAWDLTKVEASQVRYVVQDGWQQHDDWDASTLENDLAIIPIPPVTFNTRISPIKLPTRSQADTTFLDYTATVSGWGKDSDLASTITDIMRYVEVPIISNTACNKFYLGSIKATNICASGFGGKSSCNGDSGGPMTVVDVVNRDTTTRQVGIVSFGSILGCEKQLPHGYTRVSKFLDWLRTNTGVTIES